MEKLRPVLGSSRLLGWIFLLQLSVASAQTPIDYDAIAANFGTTVDEIFALGGQLDETCNFNFNATPANCLELVGALNVSDNPAAYEA